jgi:hypothetical protein
VLFKALRKFRPLFKSSEIAFAGYSVALRGYKFKRSLDNTLTLRATVYNNENCSKEVYNPLLVPLAGIVYVLVGIVLV